jgi:hypothetical protein
MTKINQYILGIILILIGSMAGGALMQIGVAYAGTIYTFSSNDTLSPTQLNSNFQHIHNLMVGGHGARLTDSDVSATAGISHSKLAAPKLLPKAWAGFASSCAGVPCAETLYSTSTGVSGIQHTATGVWTVTWSTPRSGTTYGVWISSAYVTDTPPASLILCHHSRVGVEFAAATVKVECETRGGGTLIDAPWNILMLDPS